MLLEEPWRTLTPSSLALVTLLVNLALFESVKKAVIYAIIAQINSNEDLKNHYSSHVTKLSESVNSAVQAGDTQKISELSERVSKEIQRLEDILSKPNNLYNHSLPSPSPSADSAELHSKLEALKKVEKLCEFHGKFKSGENPSKNLLENLCSGIETFLGFNKDSKGYDGTGIVYSDLDRLCDGVMGFLSGVLGAVKNENEVTTYDKNESNNINTVIKKLQSSIGSGREGLAASVDAVKGWLEGYEREVNNKITAVVEPIEVMKNLVERDKNEIEKEKDKNLITQVKEWTERAGRYVSLADQAEKALKHIDPTLLGKLNCNISLLVQATGTFEEAARNEDLKDMYEEAGSKWNAMLQHVEEIVNARRKWLQDLLDVWIRGLYGKLFNMKSKQLYDLQKSVDDGLQWHFNTVSGGLANLLDRYKGQFVPEVEGILAAANKLKDDVLGEKKTIKKLVEYLDQRMQVLRQSDTTVKEKMRRTTLEHFKNGDGDDPWNLAQRIDGVIDVIETNVKGHVKIILEEIEGQVSRIKQHVGDKKAGHTKPEDSSIYHNWDALKDELTGFVDTLTSPGGSSLTQIVNGIRSYAEGFGSGKFVAVLKPWIGELVNDGAIYGKIFEYVLNNDRKLEGGDRPSKIRNVKSVITNNLPDFINTHIESAAVAAALDNANVSNIAEKYASFSVKLESEFEDTDGNGTIELAVKAIDKLLKTSGSSVAHTDADINLTAAVKGIVNSVINRFKQAAPELQRFVGVLKISNLTQAITQTVDIGKQFNNVEDTDIILGTPDHGYKIDVALGLVHAQIKNLHDNINNGIKQTIGAENVLPIEGDLVNKVVAIKAKVTSDQFDNKLETLLKETANKAFDKLHTKITELIDGTTAGFKHTLKEVKLEMQKLQTPITHSTDAGSSDGISDIQQQTDKLHNRINEFLTNKVGQSATMEGSVYEALATLQKDIGKLGEQVTLVRANVSAVGKELEECMKYTDEMLRVTHDETEKSFNKLRHAVDIRIRQAFKELQEKAKMLYTARKRKQVTDLQKIVNKRFDKIEEIIKFDKQLGLKGYLSKLRSKFMPPLSSFTETLSPPRSAEKKLLDFSPIVKNSFKNIFDDLQKQLDLFPTTMRVNAISNALDTLLTSLTRYDHTFTKNLAKVKSEIDDFAQQTYANTAQKVSLSLVPGLRDFVKELEKAYVRVYDGHPDRIDFDNLVKKTGQIVDLSGPARWITVSTPDGTKLAKILLTIFNFIYEDIIRLINKCEDNWENKVLCISMKNEDNPLGLFLQRCGYLVAKREDSKDGETQCRTSITGQNMLAKFNEEISNVQVKAHLTACESNLTDEGEPKKQAPFNFADLLDCLLHHIDRYNEVCHYSTHFARRQPCSVYEMLIWLSGLPYSVARPALLQDGIGNLLDNANKKALADVDGISLLDHESSYLDANPRKITWYGITEALEILCSSSYDLLVSIAGTGDAGTIYGSDLCNNSFKFKYPASGEDCLDMLLDILRRLFPPLRFLQTQCSVSASHNGWLQCTYGRDVLPANWPCKEHPTDKSKCQPNCQVNSQPSCQPKSPLMSFLSDCHVGCLPHKLTSIGCRYECKTCPTNKPGMPCLTPLGFRGFSGSMRTGKDLCNVLAKFFGNPYLASFLCLAPKAPSTLPEHFSFTLSLVTGWNNHSKYDTQTLKKSIDKSISGVSIDLYKNASELTDAVSNAYSHCTAALPKCEDSHLMDLTSSSTCNKNQYSAPYLESLCADSYLYLANKHSNAYLSWILYLPWNFHKYLESLLAAFKDIFCNDWGCRSCLNGKCKKGEHGVLDNTCQCTSMVKCSGVMPILYRYGFAFQDAPTLDARKSAMKCFDFQTILFKVTRSNYFSKLFDECDMFLWRIREPFSYLVLTLWLLSLLYLLHIMVIRLDLLHIKSHLHSPSSHRIAAQSLLAAARVNKLNRVFYLQP
ncbi:hypothetical protein BBBOND_0314010 [Babesia bigemina]|uniref:C3H1-type domain-containing protein n=1 Tax=Babesia bigemina TaxID=5866 RepID=A0A061DDK2_BABBI|nr:hypothetical protein BBBOND_0314010 [Babesia bigemina]CDR97499.1 hypothetical protein BBBOND_0314010 [Babesia bigemina]|eukprot:XP_012769685.1 hypothetical protein BBBOND_0314010 [Babesia bigemina]